MNSYLVCCPPYLKKRIMAIVPYDDHVKYLSSEELLSGLSYSYDIKALYYIYINYADRNFDISKIFLKQASLLSDGAEKSADPRVEGLVKIREGLIAKGLFTQNEAFRRIISHGEVRLIGLEHQSGLIKLLHEKGIAYQTEDVSKYIGKLGTKAEIFPDTKEEMIETADRIENLLSNGIDPASICVVIKKDMMSFLHQIGKMSGLEISFDNVLLSTSPIFRSFIGRYSESGLNTEDVDKTVSNPFKSLVISQIAEGLKKLGSLGENRKFGTDFLNDYAASCSFSSLRGIKAFSSLDKATNYQHVFLLGFDESYPQTVKDKDYLNDRLKSENTYLNPSEEENAYNQYSLLNQLATFDDLHITVSIHDASKGDLYISSLICDKNGQISKGYIQSKDAQFGTGQRYSDAADKMDFSIKKAEYQNYGTDSSYFQFLLTDSNLAYMPFVADNLGPFFDMSGREISFSVSSMKDYAICPYLYLLNNIYKINDQEDHKAVLNIGNIGHHVLENHGNGKEITFEEALDFCKIDLAQASNSEKFYYRKSFEATIRFIKYFDGFIKDGGFSTIETEKEFNKMKIDGIDAEFNGKIDAILLKGSAMLVIDYKSGNHLFDVDNIVNGFDMQLAFYSYICSHNIYPDKELLGMFFVPFITDNEPFSNHPYEPFSGIILNKDQFEKGIEDPKLLNSYIHKKKIQPSDYLKKVDEAMKKKTAEIVSGIRSGKFPVTRKYILKANGESSDVSQCQYCPYADCCFADETDKNQTLYISKFKFDDESDAGQDESEEDEGPQQ